MKPAYDDIAQWYDTWVRDETAVDNEIVPIFIDFIGDINSQAICDVACGQGRIARALAQLAEGETDQRQKQEQEIAHHAKVQKLEALAKKEEKVWNQVFDLIALKQSKPYEQAVALLVDLRDLAEYQGKLEEFQLAIKQMKKDYSNRPGLISRLQKAGLL